MSSGAMAMANHTPGADKCSWHSLKINLLWIVKLLQCLSAGSPFSPSKLTWLFNRDWISPQQIDVLLCALKLFYGSLYDLLLPANQQLKCQFVLSFPQACINSDPLLNSRTRHLGEISSHCCGTLKAVIHCAFHLFLWRNQCVKSFLNKKLCFMLKRKEIPVSSTPCSILLVLRLPDRCFPPWKSPC